MSSDPHTRFTRKAGSISSDRLTIEREKIRHRRPDDMRIHDQDDDAPSLDATPSSYRADDDYEEPHSPWTDEGDEWQEPEQEEEWADQEVEGSSEEQSWDDDQDDEWVFNAPTADEASDDDGVVWEDTDDIHMGVANASPYDDEIIGPEVELAGRRDVRPRAPRPRSATAKRPAPAPAQDDHIAPPSRPQRMRVRPSGETAPHQPRPSTVRQPPAERPSGRFARTQATIEQSHDAPPPARRAPAPQTKRRVSSKRSTSPLPATPSYARSRGRGRKLVLALIMVAVLGIGGWFGYRELVGSDANGLIEGWQETFGLAEKGRTAADTPFQQTTPPEEAVASLPRESQGGGSIDVEALDIFSRGTEEAPGSQAGGPLNPQDDPVVERGDGPPLPKFKPRNALESLSRSMATRTDDSGAVERDEQTEPSIFERFWSYLRSG